MKIEEAKEAMLRTDCEGTQKECKFVMVREKEIYMTLR